jgi:hypothetical protein
LADKSTQLLLDALTRAAADPGGLPLYAGKGTAGLFPTSALARQAAQRGKEEGYVRVVTTEARGKAVQEVCAITEKGLAYLLSQVSPRQVLEDLVRAVEARQAQLGQLVTTVRQAQASFEALRALAERALQQAAPRPAAAPLPCDKSATTGNGSRDWTAAALDELARRQAGGAADDYPLPDLYRAARQVAPALTIGQFQDGLRQLHDQGQIYLHPWTGPLYEIPEPPYALLIGHVIAYYASLRRSHACDRR